MNATHDRAIDAARQDSYRRSVATFVPLGDREHQLQSNEPSPDANIMFSELLGIAKQVIGSEMHFAALELQVEGLTMVEIADTLGISVGTVKSRLFKARKSLAAAVADGCFDGYET